MEIDSDENKNWQKEIAIRLKFMKLLIKNGHIVDPTVPLNQVMDLLIEDGKIIKVEKNIQEEVEKVVYADGKYVMPGFIDLHVHLREPGFEYKETIQTGALAAARGGFTTICPMPNTKPATDSPERIRSIIEKAKKEAVVHVLPVGAITIGQEGKVLTDIEGMKKAGAVAISEDGKSVMNAALYQEAMKLASENDLVVMAHCEDKNLAGSGAMNAGKRAEELEIAGISNAVEDVIVARDILLSKETNTRLHLCHCSTKDSVRMIKEAKEEGLLVTGEVCPHHFTLTEDDIKEDDANFKMNPPLRTKKDVEALKEGLKEGIMDVISTDHAPHSEEEKKKSIKDAPFGIVGLETAAALTITELVRKGYLDFLGMAQKMSTNPAKVLGIDKGSLRVGKDADITILDPEECYIIEVKDFASKGKNSPFQGREVYGKIKMTIVDGEIVYQDGIKVDKR